ncbi:MAG: hypothetical protein M1827_003465 [Pycnora praestabilis]|nr:MAG: hypothetical protein M1827_003465 [Pycnora praestabilis]
MSAPILNNLPAVLRSKFNSRIVLYLLVSATILSFLTFFSSVDENSVGSFKWSNSSSAYQTVSQDIDDLRNERDAAVAAKVDLEREHRMALEREHTSQAVEISNLRGDRVALETELQHVRAALDDATRRAESDRAQAASSYTPAATPSYSADGYRNLGLGHLNDSNNIVLVMKIGATTAMDRLPVHLVTTMTHVPNFLIFSDAEQRLGGYRIHDALDDTSPSMINGSADFKLYRELQEYIPLRQDPNRLKLAGGWNLDKYKFIPVLAKTYQARPDADWYVFAEADTYVMLSNLLLWLRQLDPTQEQYLGSPSLFNNVVFGHGGTGFILSKATLQATVGEDPNLALKYEQEASDSCCGDYVVAKALLDHGIRLEYAWPKLNGETPYTVPFSEEQWCSPIMTFHHMQPLDIQEMWDFEKMNATPGRYIRYSDIFDHFVYPYLSPSRELWDNLSPNEYHDSEVHLTSSFETCRLACESREDCLQFMMKEDKCTLGNKILLGQKVPLDNMIPGQYRSGWMMARIEQLRNKMNPCDRTGSVAGMATITVSQQARLSYIALSSIRRTFTSTASQSSSSQFHRSDFTGQGFTGSYEPGQPTSGPLGDAPIFGAPRLTPKVLKQHLDQFVVGQERAKKVLSVAVYNHYQRVQELQRRDEEEEELLQQEARRKMGDRHPVEVRVDEFPGQQATVHLNVPPPPYQDPRLGSSPIIDYTPLTIEKSNIMMLGPSGVGKTLMAKTLARVLEVPFSMSDCTPFTQAGYIGEDAEVCVQRLLAASNYDVARAERGIICLDEVDKIATARVSSGKDVSGEGVQQALLKIIEGTTLQVQAKQEKGAAGGRGGPGTTHNTGYPTNSPLSGGGMGTGHMGGGASGSSGSGKGDVYNIRTDNILFIFTGAFIGLQKLIMDRVSRGSIGFGQPVRASNAENQTSLRGEAELFKKYLPFFTPNEGGDLEHNPLDLVEPGDLQKYGLIPELVGRIPVSTALAALDEEALARVLTEPRNSLMRQYEQLFQLSGVELRFTSGALREVAKAALGMGTGARGLRTVMERLLGDAMFEAPGSSVKYILITTLVAQKKTAPIYLGRGQQHKFHSMIATEEEEWEERKRRESGEENQQEQDVVQNFEQYREKAKAAGFV